MSYSGIILAGGKSSRMGQDKALLELDGIPLIQHISSLLNGFTNEVIIASNNKTHHSYGNYGVMDNYPGCGPMAGIEAGLNVASNDACIVLSCDSPFVSKSILDELISVKNTEAVIATCSGHIHPLIGVYRKSSLDTIQPQLGRKQLKMHDLLEGLSTKYVQFPASMEQAFNNINTQEEWNRVKGK